MKKTSEGAIAGWLITAWFIWLVVVLSTLISVCVIFQFDREPWDWGSRDLSIIAMAAALAILFAWMSYLAPSFFFRRRGGRILKNRGAAYLAQFLFAMLVAYMVCVLGQVCAFTGLPPLVVAAVFFGCTWCLFIVHLPTERKIRAWSDDSSAEGGSEVTEALGAARDEMTATGVWEESTRVLKKRGAALFAVAGAWMLPASVVLFFWTQWLSTLETLGPIENNSSTVILTPFWAAALGSGILVAAGALAGRSVGFVESMAGTFRRLVALIVAVAVVRLAAQVGFLLLVVPGVLLSIRFALTVPILMVEERGPIEALKASWARTREYQLTIFYALVPIWLFIVVTALIPMVFWANVAAPTATNSLAGVSTNAVALFSALGWGGSTLASVLFATVESVLHKQVSGDVGVLSAGPHLTFGTDDD